MKAKITERKFMTLGKRIRTRSGELRHPMCLKCGSIWKQVVETRKGRKLIRRRVFCFVCGKRQYGKRAQVGRG